MKILVLILTYHKTYFHLFSLIFAHLTFFETFKGLELIMRGDFLFFICSKNDSIEETNSWIKEVAGLPFCFDFLFNRYYPFQDVIQFRNYPFQELSFSGYYLIQNLIQKPSFSGSLLCWNFPLQEPSFSGILQKKVPGKGEFLKTMVPVL